MSNDLEQNDDLVLKKEDLQFQTLEQFAKSFGTKPVRQSDYHFTYILIYIEAGYGDCIINGRKRELEPKTLILVNPFSYLHLSNCENVTGLVITFSEIFLCRNTMEEHLLYKATFTPNYAQFFHLDNDNTGSSYVFTLLSMFEIEYNRGFDLLLKMDILHNILYGIIQYIHKLQLENANTLLDLSEPESKSHIIHFIQLLNTHFKEQSSLQFYADKMKLTQEQLAQVCKKGIGRSPKSIMQEKLLSEAKRLLLYDGRSIKEIGYELGFSEPTNFNKFFQKYTKLSPRQYRISLSGNLQSAGK